VAAAVTTRDEVEDFILGLLAEDEDRDVEELRAELVGAGADMPYDSILLVELMGRVEVRFGVRLEPSPQTARDMRSVRTFAERVCAELDEIAHAQQPSESATEGDGGDE
jgi:acyl carrier protein